MSGSETGAAAQPVANLPIQTLIQMLSRGMGGGGLGVTEADAVADGDMEALLNRLMDQ